MYYVPGRVLAVKGKEQRIKPSGSPQSNQRFLCFYEMYHQCFINMVKGQMELISSISPNEYFNLFCNVFEVILLIWINFPMKMCFYWYLHPPGLLSTLLHPTLYWRLACVPSGFRLGSASDQCGRRWMGEGIVRLGCLFSQFPSCCVCLQRPVERLLQALPIMPEGGLASYYWLHYSCLFPKSSPHLCRQFPYKILFELPSFRVPSVSCLPDTEVERTSLKEKTRHLF